MRNCMNIIQKEVQNNNFMYIKYGGEDGIHV